MPVESLTGFKLGCDRGNNTMSELNSTDGLRNWVQEMRTMVADGLLDPAAFSTLVTPVLARIGASLVVSDHSDEVSLARPSCNLLATSNCHCQATVDEGTPAQPVDTEIPDPVITFKDRPPASPCCRPPGWFSDDPDADSSSEPEDSENAAEAGGILSDLDMDLDEDTDVVTPGTLPLSTITLPPHSPRYPPPLFVIVFMDSNAQNHGAVTVTT